MKKENQISANMLVPWQGCKSCPVKKAARRAGVEFFTDKRTCDPQQQKLCEIIVERTFNPHIQEFVRPNEGLLVTIVKDLIYRT